MRPPAKDAVRKCEWRRFFWPFANRTVIRMPVSEKTNMKEEKERANPYRLRWTRHKGTSRKRSRVPRHAPLSRAPEAVAWGHQ